MPDAWLDPLLVVNRRLRFQHTPADVAAAREFIGSIEAPDPADVARAIVRGVHQRMHILASAFGYGAPTSLPEIVSRHGGNCVSHAVLAAVLLRDRGIPTRLVVEDVYTDVSLLRAPAALLPAPIGPTLNGHVWLETLIDGDWQPADAEIGIFGAGAWLAERIGKGTRLAALGIPVREYWQFPLRIRRLGPDGGPDEDVSQLYLVERIAAALGESPPIVWADGVRYFSSAFNWEGRPGLRLLGQRRRLRAMRDARSAFGPRLAAPAG